MSNLQRISLEEGSEKIINGELVIFPTETVYGLGANCENDESVRRIYLCKKRPLTNPVIIHVNGLEIQGRIATLELRTKKNSERNSIFISADYPQPILRQWKIIDAQKKETTIFFSKIKAINPLLDNFFEIK